MRNNLQIQGRDVLSLKKLAGASVLSRAVKPLSGKSTKGLPTKIGDFKLKSRVKKTGPYKSFLIGIYENSKGEKAFAKMWQGKVKDFWHYTLVNESIMAQIIEATVARIGESMPKEYRNIKVPKHLKTVKSKNLIIVLFEHIDFNSGKKLSSTEKLKVYFRLSGFLKFIGDNLSEGEKRLVSKRALSDLIMLYPLLLVAAIFKNPRAFLSLIGGIPLFIKSTPILLKRNGACLVHRDFHFDNVLVSKQKVVLTDLELCLFSNALYELVNTARCSWQDHEFSLGLLCEAKRRHSSKGFDTLLKGLMTISTTHGLTDKHKETAVSDYYLGFLKTARFI